MKILLGSSEEVLKTLPDNSVDSIVTDPPYGLSFMGKKWDYDVPSTELWAECLRVLKPGGYLLAFAGTRTQHRMAVRIEDAGFEIRDMIAWVYGSGFPKSLNIGKAVDKVQGNEREVIGDNPNFRPVSGKEGYLGQSNFRQTDKMSIQTKGNSPYEGWGTALKPALEPITVARKPISEKNIAENVLKWGTGGINIDESRVEAGIDHIKNATRSTNKIYRGGFNDSPINSTASPLGRFPANLIHDGSNEVVGLFPETAKSSGGRIGNKGSALNMMGQDYSKGDPGFGDSGSAARYFKVCNDDDLVSVETGSVPGQKQTGVSLNGTKAQPRFIYTAKASKSERNKGLEEFEVVEVRGGGGRVADGYDESTQHLKEAARKYGAVKTAKQNIHPTVKPVSLMRYLVKMVTPAGGTVLDPFNGSGTTGIACKVENFEYIGIEREEEYVKISEARIAAWEPEKEEPQLGMF